MQIHTYTHAHAHVHKSRVCTCMRTHTRRKSHASSRCSVVRVYLSSLTAARHLCPPPPRESTMQ